MARTKISEFSATPGNNTDIDGINIAEGCAPSGINDAIRELMAQLKDFQAGTSGDSFNGPVGTTTAAAGAFTTLSASSTVSGTGFSNYLASPPAIGGTAAAAISATTLTTSSTVTHNGGTANGVAYLNGSKVLTTGSALTFDGTTLSNAGTGDRALIAKAYIAGDANGFSIFTGAGQTGTGWYTNGTSNYVAGYISGSEQMRLTSTSLYTASGINVGIGTSSPSAQLEVSRSATNAYSTIRLSNSGASGRTYEIGLGGNAAAAGYANNLYFYDSTAGSLRMVLDSSGNLGIGTSSPGQKLDVVGNMRVTGSGNFTNSAATPVRLQIEGGANDFASIYADTASAYKDLVLQRYGGNLGLGVTPSAWALFTGNFELNNGNTFSGNAAQNSLTQNAYYGSGGWTYKTTAAASRYQQISGAHAWHTAASGTAGNAITFTQAMTLDANGNLGVGETNPGARLHVDSGSTGNYAIFKSTNANGGYAAFYSSSTVQGDIGTAAQIVSGGAATDFGVNARGSRNLIFGTNNTERARIDSSGNLIQTVNTTAATLTTNQTMTISIVNNSTLKFSVRGSDGTTRSATLVLV